MGVLKVNVGDATTPDWRNIGCGDPGVSDFADRSATCASTMNGPLKYVGTWAGGQVPIPPQPLIPADGHGAWRYVVVPSGTATSSVCSLSVGAMSYHDADGSYGYWSGTTTMPAGSDVYVFAHDDLSGFPPVPSPGPGDTSNPNVYAATAGRLKLWDGTRWMREVCTGDPTGGIVDNFNRADGATLLPNRSDGGLWTVGSSSDMQIFSNRLGRPTSGIGSGSIAIWADYGYASTVSVQFDFARTGFAALYAHIAIDVSGSQGYEVQFYPFDGGYIIIKNSGGTVIVNQLIGNSWTDGTARTAVITFNYSTGVINVAVAGTTYVTYTDTGTLPTATGLTLFPGGSYSGDGMYFDNVSVTGTGAPERHPLKMWDGTTWQTVTCMTPA